MSFIKKSDIGPKLESCGTPDTRLTLLLRRYPTVLFDNDLEHKI